MAVKISTWAWEMPLKSTEKLVLLALADHANEDGICWPHIETIAKKCGLSRSPTIEHLKKLHDLGFFTKETVYGDNGKKRGNIYTLNLSLSPESVRSKLLSPDLLRSKMTLTKSGIRTQLSPESGPIYKEEPSLLNHHESSSTCESRGDSPPEESEVIEKTKKPKQADCPHEEIIDLYHEALPNNPHIAKWTPNRKKNLQARWKDEPDLEAWRKFFKYVSKSDFLTGKINSPGRRPFFATLDWLIKQDNYTKVIEGRYHGN